MNYEEIVHNLLPSEKHSNIGILESEMRVLVLRKNSTECNWSAILKTKNHKKIEKFLMANGMPKNEGVNSLVKSIIKISDIGLFSTNNKDHITLGFRKIAGSEHINYPKEYKKLLTAGVKEDAIRITYDLKKDKITYVKSYCDYEEKRKDHQGKLFKNFLFSVDEDRASLIQTQDCLHGKVKNINDVPTILQEDYEAISHLNLRCSFADRKNSDQAYLYIKQSL